MFILRFVLIAFVLTLIISCTEKKSFDVVIRGGTIYDGSGGDPVVADIGINSDTIAAIGDLSNAVGKSEVDAKGLSVAPGFINMLSQAMESLIVDGKSQGDIRQV
jgi:N-acyl-D-amino-acid deacylase